MQKDLCVIDDEMIISSYIENLKEKKSETEKRNLRKKFKTFQKLIFSYKNIYKIQGLRGLEKLEILKLDNNLISKIENLSELKNLKSLDLSFNKIKKIENLEKLENLTDLSLYHNLIEEINYSDLKGLKKLSLISVSHNKIKNIMDLLRAIKPIKSLEVLTVANNPLTNDSEYKNYIFANMPDLKYLDYIYIDEIVKAGSDDYKYKADFKNYFENLKNEHEGKIGNFDNNEILEKLNKYHLMNYDEYLLSGNEDLDTLRSIPGSFEESLHKISENMKNLLEDIKNNITEIIKNKEFSILQFETAFDKMIKENEEQSLEFIRIYSSDKKNLIRFIDETQKSNKHEKIEEIFTTLKNMEENLVKKEMILNNRLKKSYNKLDSMLKKIYNELIDALAGEKGIKNVEDFLQKFFKKFLEEALKELYRCENDLKTKYIENVENLDNLENLENEEDEGPWTQDQISLLESPDDLKNSINTIKESVENKHRSVDNLIRKDIENEKNGYLMKISKNIKKLNRNNIYNIIMLVKDEKNFWNDKKRNLN